MFKFALTVVFAFALATAYASPALKRVAQPGVIRIHPVLDTSKCLDVRGGVLANGTPVQLFECNGTPAQNWVKGSINPTDSIKLNGTDFCLDAGSAPANGVGMKIWQCFDNLPAQEWTTTANNIVLFGSGLCLDVTDGNTADGTQVQTWQCTDNNSNQAWTTLV